VELRAEDLRFTPQETATLLGEAIEQELPSASLAALQARTEGWAAGLQLASPSLRGRADPAGFLASFSGSHRFVLDYMAEEVLDRQPEHLRTFLLETSVLARLSGPLCDAVTGRSDSQDLLEEVERANLFLVPLDEVRRWWRYHHLFADLLRARLERERPERLQALHGNAATWCEGHGLVDDAIGHAVAADDPQRAARLVERNAEELMQRSEGATVHGWLRALPVELVRARPQLSLAKAMAALVEGRSDPDEIEPLLEDAEHAPGTSEPYQPSVGRGWQPAGQRPGRDGAGAGPPGLPAPRRRGDRRVRAASPSPADRGGPYPVGVRRLVSGHGHEVRSQLLPLDSPGSSQAHSHLQLRTAGLPSNPAEPDGDRRGDCAS
jgi:ATP/maltotriose-dependent transcriptional regulator MalT